MHPSQFKLGKLPFTPKAKDLRLSSYIADKGRLLEAADVPAAPDMTALWTPAGTRPVPDTDDLGNSEIGLCVYAAPGHKVRLIGQLTGQPMLFPTRTDVIGAYAKGTGYNPVTGAGDNGASVRDMLGGWQRDGLYGTKALAYVLVDNRDPDQVAIATWACCGLIGGYKLPVVSQDQDVWSIPPGGWPAGKGSGTWGNHCIFQEAQSPTMRVGNSWGIRKPWTQEWDAGNSIQPGCCDELWMVLVDAWQMAGRAPVGIAWADLMADVAARTE